MRIGRLLAGLAPVLLAASIVVPAAADPTPPTLYVDGGSPVSGICNDSGPGTYSRPLCDLQAAANIVLPGQTVVFAPLGPNQTIPGDIHITRSGTPDQPITFEVGPGQTESPLTSPVSIVSGTDGFVLDGVHDVAIDGFQIQRVTSTGIVVNDSSDITINHDFVTLLGQQNAVDAVDVNDSSGVTISRSYLTGNGADVSVGPGSTGADIVDDILSFSAATSVTVDGAAGTDITNDIADENGCPGGGLAVSGGATGTSIENNIIGDDCATSAPLIGVAADSTASTRSDYNLVNDLDAQADAAIYSWGGTSYRTAKQLAAATGQGTHDLNTQPGTRDGVPEADSAAVDSADADAPGILATDFNGDARVDDPYTANTGTGVGYVDRGAFELQDPMTVSVSMNTRKAPTGGTVVATVTAAAGWGPITGYTVDFGDGTTPTSSTSPTITHVYAAVSDAPYQITATVTDSLGNTATAALPADDALTVVPPAPLVPVLAIGQENPSSDPLEYGADISGSTDSWSLASATCDFGDRSGVQQGDGFVCFHDYAAPGTYVITMTVTDVVGNTASASQSVVIPQSRKAPQPVSGGGSCKVCY